MAITTWLRLWSEKHRVPHDARKPWSSMDPVATRSLSRPTPRSTAAGPARIGAVHRPMSRYLTACFAISSAAILTACCTAG
jgi:hypothetical protein